ncbi:GMC family oxidoreductase N-terminal domain-containing protein [uncultured Methylophaga sp.]|uniref:GMC family oxidoreductase N-terminal domain-containing protein n=1 Tax=uncultured Methylophaga sp. TaxID=285271 RepID=UPI002617823D|nr:GMC family oxidoreductase N-terminal domain-containing protein [uncultured Methylophaga sp.]
MKRLSSDLSDIQSDPYDVIVIGSGYGGAIAASRLARAGQTVCLLERGREFLLGEFPDTEAEALREMQFHLPGKHLGDETGLYDIHVQAQQNVVVGCGLGGTSLINANVSLPPTAEVLSDPAWPQQIRDDEDGLLQQGFELAADMLKPTPYPDDYPPLNKLKAHRQSAQAMGADFSRPPINVNFDSFAAGVNHVGVEQLPCNNCGDCVSGCNYGAKNTTQMNYLPDAWNHGAEIFCQASVHHLQQKADGWRVYYQPVEMGRERFDAPLMFVDARKVVLAAGTLGSNEILLRSREQGLALSDKLGHGFTGNGDMLGFAYNCDDLINGVGFGTRPPGELNPVGPCITGLIDLRHHPDKHQRMVIEEGALPGALGQALPSALASAAGWLGDDTDNDDALDEQGNVWQSILRGPYHGAVNQTQTFLVMSHDDAQGVITLEHDRVNIDWPDLGAQANFAHAHQRLTEATTALGGSYVENPLWSPLFHNSLVTVHPLGGCAMSADASEGVVNHKGQVFTGQDDTVYSDLYVSDGSVIPTSIAVNPLFTISALTERCCALMARDNGWVIDYSLPSAPNRPHPPQTMGLRFTETMRGHFAKLSDNQDDLQSFYQAELAGQADDNPMEFTLTIVSDDLQNMLNDPAHAARINGSVHCPALSDKALTVSAGHFNLFQSIDSPPDSRQMRYRMLLHAESGEAYFFDGFKLIKNDPGISEVWTDTTTLFVTLYRGTDDSGSLVGKAVLHIAPVDLLRQMSTLEVIRADNWEQRLRATADFGRFFAGTLYQTYGGVFFNPDSDTPTLPRKKRPLRAPAPEVYPLLTEDGVELKLTRYQGGQKGPVMLVHGLGVASSIFSTDMIDTNLVEYLVANGFDVWLLDYRVSILLPAAAHQSNGDQVARFDYPAAISKIKLITGADTVQALVHCYGATTFIMSMLAGLEGVRSIVCSQIATDIVVPTTTALKTGLHLPSFLERLGVDSLTADPPDDGGSLLTDLYHKALDINALANAQGQCHNDSCHRITFMYASLYRHDQLNHLLHSNLDELFAEANIETLAHLATMCRAGKLVDSDGNDSYLPHLERLNLPILFISGEDNECYLPESTKRTYNRLCQRFGNSQYQRHVIPAYAHIDCIFGDKADIDVYPLILAHLLQTA